MRPAGITVYLATSLVVFTDRPSFLKKDEDLKAQLIKFVETRIAPASFFLFSCVFMWWYVRPVGIMVHLATTRSVVFTDRRSIVTGKGRKAPMMKNINC